MPSTKKMAQVLSTTTILSCLVTRVPAQSQAGYVESRKVACGACNTSLLTQLVAEIAPCSFAALVSARTEPNMYFARTGWTREAV
ncbi:hypothetical protein F5Y19DRAFT_62287 [Xylariaceae sp. FL1651]|nr:hypothetical protein F5Y19DRAFT_62287 [Xylariaceae sp. FL1651]